jgi:ubiquinone/menaquinone biosynthesis C-methylase UbiE
MSVDDHPDLHSAAWFGPSRDYWWNRDFLELMARRLRLADVRSLADIGCGVGHWSRLLFPLLHPEATLLGVDREREWTVIADEAFRAAFPGRHGTFVSGDATALPAENNRFDAVSCQTVLMHLAIPADGLAEMIRVCKPGGVILCVEPNNLYNMFERSYAESIEEHVAEYEFWVRWQFGKVVLGEGDNSLGERLPGMFAAAGLTDIRVHMNDQAMPLFPPYDLPAQRAAIFDEEQAEARGTSTWDVAGLERYFFAGGGARAALEAQVARMKRSAVRRRESIARGEFSEAGGSLVYLVSGRKR